MKNSTGIIAGLAFLALGGLSSAAEKPTIVAAADWGSTPQAIPEESRQTPSLLTIHHAGELWNEGDDPVKKLVGLQKFGQTQKNWPDLPYHFLIAPDGRVFEGRAIEYQPESNTNYDLKGHVGIMLWGNFEVQRVSREQIASAAKLSAWLCEKYKIDPATIKGHKDRAQGQTVCPGLDLARYIDGGQFQKLVAAEIAGEMPKVELLPQLPAGPAQVIPGGTLGTESEYR